jgi:hypothetical protein
MLNFAKRIAASCMLVAVTAAPALAGDSSAVALVTKTIQIVSKKTPATDWSKAAKGDPLSSGAQVQTGVKSLAVVKFIDNSIVRVREQSELTISGESSSPRLLSKEVRMSQGVLGFDVKKQKQNEQFRFTSPTSVASIRGTKGKRSCGANGDTLLTLEGLVNLRNSVSNKELDIPAGWIGFCSPDGSITSRKATEDELNDARNLVDGTANDIKIELQDSKGNKKDLRIKNKQ